MVLLTSRYPRFCASYKYPLIYCEYLKATPSPEVTELFCRVPSAQFSQTPSFTKCIHLCRFKVRLNN